MKKPDEQVIQALCGLRADAQFRRVIQWFEKSLIEQREQNDIEDNDVTLRQGQGKARIIKDFLDEYYTAEETRKRFTSRRVE